VITDDQTNYLYLSEHLVLRATFFFNLRNILDKIGVQYQTLPHTKDIWIVDYMPIQKDIGTFIQFKYGPDYLQDDKFILTQTDPNPVCEAIKIRTIKSGINIDGGNVIRGRSWVILTDKIFKENQDFSRNDLINTLERIFKVKVIIIPQEPNDYLGHADGIVRYYDDNTVLINKYKANDKKMFQRNLKKSLRNAGLEWIEIPYNPDDNNTGDEAHGLYINYLQMKNFILVPTFGLRQDTNAVNMFEQLFSGHTIRTINSREIAKDGGVLNCITWNIKIGTI